jgi:hypothetical protein
MDGRLSDSDVALDSISVSDLFPGIAIPSVFSHLVPKKQAKGYSNINGLNEQMLQSTTSGARLMLA